MAKPTGEEIVIRTEAWLAKVRQVKDEYRAIHGNVHVPIPQELVDELNELVLDINDGDED